MGKFMLTEYTGDDAGGVLLRLLGGMGVDNDDEHDVESETSTREQAGFRPNEPETEDVPDEPNADKQRLQSKRATLNGDNV